MKIDVKTRTFALANKTGGLSGPAIHPVAVRMVYEAAHAVKIPIIGMGGIATAEDALEMILAGATCVAVGTANFRDPAASVRVVDGIRDYLERTHTADVKELIGAVR
ncbi:MAG: HisA/HisF-related TIM barrel protein, partial [Lachnospira sp.]|nr:HisA/HisF-related TIM barrel protein [Lachnospira sp.]